MYGNLFLFFTLVQFIFKPLIHFDLTEDISYWLKEYPFIGNLIKYIIWITIVFFIFTWVRQFLKRKLPDNSMRYKSQKAVELIGYGLIILITISYFTGNIKDFGLAIGLLTAGITITLQELILSIAGSFYIFFVRVYKAGDRIQINGIKGDVIDVDSFNTTMMEIGEWISGDNYSGRIVKISNAFVFKGPVYNYSQDFPFVWDEMNLPIRYGSDIELARSIIMEVAHQNLAKFVQDSVAGWKEIVNKYYIENAQVEPSLALTLTDNWLQFNLRYIVDYKKRRVTKNILSEEIYRRFLQTNGKVELASATYEVVAMPPIQLQDNRKENKQQ